MKLIPSFCLSVVLMLGVLPGCDERSPSRQHIPILRNVLQRMELAVADQNRAAVDSLLSVAILDYEQGSDSLLSFVYGPDGEFSFERFELGEIAYTGDKARIDCFIMDSLHQRDRPLMFTLVYEQNMWLFKHFEVDSSSER